MRAAGAAGGQAAGPERDARKSTGTRVQRFAWALYDWAGDGFSAVIVAYVFSAYFTRSVAPDATTGTTWWGTALAIAGIATALVAPFAGGFADRTGTVKRLLFATTLLCAVACAGLWYVEPEVASVALALILVGTASFASELSKVFYNALLPRLAPPEQLGRLSGFAWSLGYYGGLVCLGLALVLATDVPVPFLDLDRARSEHIRAIGPLVAVWLLVFSAPLFLFVPSAPRASVSMGAVARGAFARLKDTLGYVRHHPVMGRFLIARLVYTDGTATLFSFGGVYAAGTFGLTVDEVLMFGIGLNVAGGLGAAAGGWVDDWIGPRRTVIIALAAVVSCGVPLLFLEGKAVLWAFGLPLGFFLGPVQPASRSLMARLTRPGEEAEIFGLFAFSGKVTAFLGPALVAAATSLFDSQRAGMSTVVAFLLAGAVLMAGVRTGLADAAAEAGRG